MAQSKNTRASSKTKDTRVFSKTIDGEVQNMVAHTAADAVRFTYDGWRDITEQVKEAAEVAAKFPAGSAKPAASKPAEPKP